MKTKKKNPAAVALGRLGGSAHTEKNKGFAAMSKERMAEVIQQREAKKKGDKEKIVRGLRHAYDQMSQEASGKRCISRLARKRIEEELWDICEWGDERTYIVRLCHLLLSRVQEPRKFDIQDDLDLLDAAEDIIAYGVPQEWTITADLELRFQ